MKGTSGEITQVEVSDGTVRMRAQEQPSQLLSNTSRTKILS